MTDEEVEDIIRSNMNMQMNLAGIRADFEEKLQRTWVGLTDGERLDLEQLADRQYANTRGQELRSSWANLFCRAIEAKLKEKNT